MPHPLDEVQHTPWGQHIERRLGILDNRVGEHERKFNRLGDKIDKIEDNTEWLVDMFRGSKAMSKLLIGLAIILGGAAVIGTWLGWMHK